MKIKIYTNPYVYDSNEIRFIIDDEEKGYGYISKSDKSIGLIRCPKCDRENYSPNVSSGICTWCGFDANKIEKI